MFLSIMSYMFCFNKWLCRSSLRDNVKKSAHGTLLDIDPRHEKISLRCLVS